MTSEDVPNTSYYAANQNIFTGNLYKEMLNYVEDKNMGVCPMALSSLLGLVHSGANDETAQEIKKAINLPQSGKEAEIVVKSVYPLMKKARNFQYVSARKIYLRGNYPIRKDYKTLAEEVYDIGLEHLDFSHAADAVRTINEFTEQETGAEVTNFAREADVDTDSQMALVCAVLLKLHLTKFQKDASVKRPFSVSAGKAVTVEFIEKNSTYNYCELADLKAKMVELPIEPKVLDLVIVLPDEPDGLELVEKEIAVVFAKHKFVEQRVSVLIPKFRVECSIDLRRVFQRLGMKKAFTPEADLSGIIAEKTQLFINHILHKTVVSFDDEMTVAGSIKPVGSVKKMASASKSFIADRPFVFYVRLKNLVVFTGRIKNPTQYCLLIIGNEFV